MGFGANLFWLAIFGQAQLSIAGVLGGEGLWKTRALGILEIFQR
jgi:hypothetical protein